MTLLFRPENYEVSERDRVWQSKLVAALLLEIGFTRSKIDGWRAHRAQIPTIYANDNFGRWRSDFRQQIETCLKKSRRGRQIVELLRPDEHDYFVLKPTHSGFFSTTLEVLLDRLQVQRVILVGFAADICVLYTANDAYMREFKVVVPSDCVASETKRQYRFALEHIAKRLKADISTSDKVRFR